MAKQVVYKIHNLCRAVETRPLRAAATAKRAPKKLLLGGGLVRVVRGRPMPVTESVVRKLQPELLEKEKLGWLKVTTEGGLRVDITTLKAVEEALPEEPKPKPKLDSAADDSKYPVGESMPEHKGGAALDEKLPIPSVIQPDIPEGKVDAQAIYESGTRSELDKEAEKMGLSTEGNKSDVAARLAEAGYVPKR